jgi:hypothetical protein
MQGSAQRRAKGKTIFAHYCAKPINCRELWRFGYAMQTAPNAINPEVSANIAGVSTALFTQIPRSLRLRPNDPVLPLKAELALVRYGLVAGG